MAILEKVSRLREKARKIHPIEIEKVQLPLWPDQQRGLPNSLARGALFSSARDSVSRTFFESKPIATLSGIGVDYRGQELRQDDASVFMTLLHLARHVPLGAEVPFTAYSMLKELGWSINKREYKHLRDCIERLSANNVNVTADQGRTGYAGSLVRAFAWRDEKGDQLSHWRVWLEPQIVRLFGEQAYTLLEWGQRRKIGGRSSLALWLHSFLCTHADPIPMSVRKYHELSGSESKNIYHFRARILVALQRLKDIGFITDFELKNDMIHLKRSRGRTARLVISH